MMTFRLYDRNGTTLLGLLPELISYSLSVEFSEVGALTFEYPTNGINASLITELREVAVVNAVGDEYVNSRYVITGINRDRVESTGTISVSARSILWRLDTALAYPDGGVASGNVTRYFDTKTPGYIVKTLIDSAQTRGALAGITYNFTATTDSDSAAWGTTTTQEYPARNTILSAVRGLTDLGLIEVQTVGRQLQATKADGIGSDKTTGNSPVILRYGYNLTEAPEAVDASSIAGAVLVEGDRGLLVERTNSTTVGTFGRLETSLTASGIDDTAVVNSLGDTYLTTLADADRQLTVGLTMQSGTPQPLVDFIPGDYVYTQTNAGLERVRVRQITVSMSGGAVTASATLGDRLYENDIAVARRISAITSGSVQAGNGTLPDPVVTVTEDTVAPSPATSLIGSSAAYVDGTDPRASVSLTWTAPTTNADGTTLTDLAYYEIQSRLLSTDAWEFEANAYTNSAKISGLTVATSYRFQVFAVDSSGNRSTASNEYVVTSANITTATGMTPSTPVATSRLGTISVTWDGLNNAGGAMPADLSYVAVHISTTTNFTPSTSTYKDRMGGSGLVVLSDLTYGTTYYIKLVAYNKSGVASTASAQASATVQRLVDTDLIANQLTTWPFNGAVVSATALQDNSVSASKILSGAVIQDKIAANAIGANQIAANAVVAGKLAAGAVTAGTIAALAIQAGDISANAITSDKISAGAITAAKIAAGTITATEISSSYVYAGTIAADKITAGTITASVSFNAASGTFTGTVNASAGTIGGFTLSSTALTAGSALSITSAGTITGGNSNTIFYGYANIGGGTATGERFIVNGSSSFVGTIISTNNITSQTHFYSPFATNVTSAANGYWVSSSGRMTYTTASSERYKRDITPLREVPDMEPKKLLDLPVRAFRYNQDYVTPTDDRAEVLMPGFIAEEVDAVYPIAADYENGQINSWNERMIIPGMLALIQDLTKELAEVKATLNGETA